MTGGLLDFFTLEASEYVDQLDGLVSRASAPPADEFTRAARALRGAATMAKVPGIAAVATGLERVARQVAAGELAWDAGTRGAAVATVDDVKLLLRAVRQWGGQEDARVKSRVAELDRLAPPSTPTAPSGPRGMEFLAAAAADAAGALLEYAENPGGATALAAAMDKVRALRGVATLNDLPPLAEVVDAVDATAKPIELGHEDATAERRRLFRTAARVLLEGGDAVRRGELPPVESPALQEFSHAAATLGGGGDADDVVPIAALLMDAPDAIQPTQHPPTTASDRFRLEVVSQAEHLRRLVAEGRQATDAASRDRLSRELRAAVRALARGAQSFGAVEISNLFIAAERGAAALDAPVLELLDQAGRLLAASGASPQTIAAQFVALSDELSKRRTPSATLSLTPPRAATPAAAPTRSPTPVAASAPAAPRAPTPAPVAAGGKAPSGAALRDLLATGLAGLEPLGETRLAEPLVGPEDDVLPIEDLTYRGKDALARAMEISDGLRQSSNPPDPAVLAELYDLLQLAAAE